MVSRHNSSKAPSTGGRYAQAVTIDKPDKLVFVSGQVGAEIDGSVPDSFDEQCRLAWRNLSAQLAEVDMTLRDIVKVTAIVCDRANIPAYRSVREEILGDHQVASTAIIADLFDERWKVEIEAIAVTFQR